MIKEKLGLTMANAELHSFIILSIQEKGALSI